MLDHGHERCSRSSLVDSSSEEHALDAGNHSCVMLSKYLIVRESGKSLEGAMVVRSTVSNGGVDNESTVGELEDDLVNCWDEEANHHHHHHLCCPFHSHRQQLL